MMAQPAASAVNVLLGILVAWACGLRLTSAMSVPAKQACPGSIVERRNEAYVLEVAQRVL